MAMMIKQTLTKIPKEEKIPIPTFIKFEKMPMPSNTIEDKDIMKAKMYNNEVGSHKGQQDQSTKEPLEGKGKAIYNTGKEVLKNIESKIKNEFKKAGKAADDYFGGYKDANLTPEYKAIKTRTDQIEKQRKANLKK